VIDHQGAARGGYSLACRPSDRLLITGMARGRLRDVHRLRERFENFI
jgi:hypothetical protein